MYALISANYTWDLAWATPASAELCFTDASLVTCCYYCTGYGGVYHYYTVNDSYIIDCDLNVVCTSCCRVSAWDWDFGDGTSGMKTQSGCHVFLAPDVYTVTLTAWAPSGICSVSAYDTYSQVLSIMPPIVDFAYTTDVQGPITGG